ncbi:hypothetical protein [Flexivirga sp.]|uniref:hypothetical protein n=1 Tax=Flexivirga sp. TaxID=1962927 RepID=UPI003F7D592C
MRTILSRTAAAALIITLPMGLSACGDSKPSKADVTAGYVKSVKQQADKSGVKIPDSLLDKMAGCIIDKSYDKVSADSLKSIKDGKTNDKGEIKVKSDDKSTFESASKDCQTKYKDELSKLG